MIAWQENIAQENGKKEGNADGKPEKRSLREGEEQLSSEKPEKFYKLFLILIFRTDYIAW